MNEHELNQLWDADTFPFRDLRHLPILIWDWENWGVTAANDAAVQLYGYSRVELTALKLSDFLPAEDVPVWFERLSQTNGASGGFSGTWRHRRKTGEYFYLQLLIVPFPWKDKTWHAGLIQD